MQVKKSKLLMFVLIFLNSLVLTAQNIPEKEICAAAIEALMDRKSISKYITTYSENGNKVHVFASRKNSVDKDACYISGNRVIWRVESAKGISKGRWRTSNYDEKVSFKIEGDLIKIIMTFSDNSQSTETYSLKKLSESIK